MTFRCESGVCGATFEHPGDEGDCESIDGKCAHLMLAGWRAVWVRVEAASKRVLFARGGFLCPACVRRYGADLKTPKAKKRRRIGDVVGFGADCPACKAGVLVEDSIGLHCSRRYALRSPCKYEGAS